MREIKFRVFRRDTKEMYPSASIWKCNFHDCEFNDELTIMQYTGIKNKNGVEIYEGDIVTDGGRNYEIRYCRSAYDDILAFHPIDKDGGHYEHYYGGWDGEYFEIIGNIHENKELLK